MNFLPIIFSSADNKLRWGEALVEALPYFFRFKPAQKKEEKLLPLEVFRTQTKLQQEKYGSQYITFAFSAIALAAKFSQIDGEANREEVAAFYAYFPLPGGSKDKAADLFYEAYMDNADTRLYARKIVNFYPGHKDLYLQLLEALIKLGFADAPMNNQEYSLLRKIATIFGVSEEELKQLLRDYLMPKGSDPYALLGAKKRTTHADIKKAYREVIRDCHPDTFIRYDLAPEVKAILIDKFKRLTHAYEAICKFRKFEG